MQSLIEEQILKYLGGGSSNVEAEVSLEALDDAAVIHNIVLKSDSHTVKPLFFPGGDIGRLSIAGTVNDIANVGGEPIALASGFVIEEGFEMYKFETILKSMQEACKEAGVSVITGDTKVVETGALDEFIINTSGIGKRGDALDRNIAEVKKYREFKSNWLVDSNIKEGDKIILSGTIGDHGTAILSSRRGYDFSVKSDVAPLNKLHHKLLEVGGIVKIKDPTRGGLSNVLYEWSKKSKVGIVVKQEKIPIHANVVEACEILGINPLHTGNEGKLVIAVIPQKAEEVLTALRETKEGKDAEIIGEAAKIFGNHVLLDKGGVEGRVVLQAPSTDPVTRVC